MTTTYEVGELTFSHNDSRKPWLLVDYSVYPTGRIRRTLGEFEGQNFEGWEFADKIGCPVDRQGDIGLITVPKEWGTADICAKLKAVTPVPEAV